MKLIKKLFRQHNESDLFKGHFHCLNLLSWKDSNPRKRNQNPMCYHYTTGQFSLILRCKGTAFSRTGKFFFNFFSNLWLFCASKTF